MSIPRLEALHCHRIRLALAAAKGRQPSPPDPSAQPGTDTRYKGQEVIATRKIRAEAAAGSGSAAALPCSGYSGRGGSTSTVKTATIARVTVLTSSKGLTLYSFAPDTPITSKCNGTCAQNWPPVKGPVTAAGITGTFGTIKRSDGSA
jgi:predicted lipoprotein with Yx(FWY)xxD motif